MLCDELTGDARFIASYDGMREMIERVGRSQRFVLAPDFAAAADGVVENVEELERVLPFCRLPYPLCWIEFTHDDRPHWNPQGPYTARPVDEKRFQGSPKRVGFLLEEVGRSSLFKVHMFWSLREDSRRPSHAWGNHNGCIIATLFDTLPPHAETRRKKVENDLDAAMTPISSDFGQGLMATIADRDRGDIIDRLYEFAAEDWGGEGRFIVAALGLLNARNAIVRMETDYVRSNPKRVKCGRLPLFSYTTLKLRSTHKRTAHPLRGGRVMEGRELRAHFVRGHFKVRTSGVYWWNMHMRGSVERGLMDKDYRVEM
jgi:hypothetical protein